MSDDNSGAVGFGLLALGLLVVSNNKKKAPARSSIQGLGLLRRDMPDYGGEIPINIDDIKQVRLNIISRMPKGHDGVQRRTVTSIDQRVGVICDLIQNFGADPRWQHAASAVLTQRCGSPEGNDGKWCIEEHDFTGECIAIFNAVKRKVRYVRDPAGSDTYSHPERTVGLEIADCDDYVILLGSLLRVIGVAQIVCRVVQEHGAPTFNHIYLMVRPDGRKTTPWYACDPSKPPRMDPPGPAQFGWEPPYASRIAAGERYQDIGGAIVAVRDFPVPL